MVLHVSHVPTSSERVILKEICISFQYRQSVVPLVCSESFKCCCRRCKDCCSGRQGLPIVGFSFPLFGSVIVSSRLLTQPVFFSLWNEYSSGCPFKSKHSVPFRASLVEGFKATTGAKPPGARYHGRSPTPFQVEHKKLVAGKRLHPSNHLFCVF